MSENVHAGRNSTMKILYYAMATIFVLASVLDLILAIKSPSIHTVGEFCCDLLLAEYAWIKSKQNND